MNNHWKLAAAALVSSAVLFGAMSASAQSTAPPKVVGKCANITWSADMLKKYPRIAAGCQSVVEMNGKKYAKFVGKVAAVNKDGSVGVRFTNVAGTASQKVITLTPAAGATVMVNGQKTAYADLKKNDKLTFYVPESTVGVISDPADNAMASILLN